MCGIGIEDFARTEDAAHRRVIRCNMDRLESDDSISVFRLHSYESQAILLVQFQPDPLAQFSRRLAMKLNTVNHPKFLKLKRLLCRPACTCAGVLEMLWQMATMFADDGDISKFSADDIAAFLDFDGDAEELLRSLIESGWVDEMDGRRVIHDWIDHCPDFIADRIRKRESRLSGSVRSCPEVSGNVRDCPEMSETVRENPYKPSQAIAKPSQAKPKPSQQQLASLQAAAAEASHWLAVDDLEDKNEIVRNANKLSKACKRLEKIFVFQAAWIGFCIDRGWLGDKIAAIADKDRPESWLRSALRSECQQRGFELAECLALVPAPPPVKEAS